MVRLLTVGAFRLANTRRYLPQQVNLRNLHGPVSGSLKSHLSDFTHIVTGKKAFCLLSPGIYPDFGNFHITCTLDKYLGIDGGWLCKLKYQLGIIRPVGFTQPAGQTAPLHGIIDKYAAVRGDGFGIVPAISEAVGYVNGLRVIDRWHLVLVDICFDTHCGKHGLGIAASQFAVAL